jgi:PAS domain S-box-containing protein
MGTSNYLSVLETAHSSEKEKVTGLAGLEAIAELKVIGIESFFKERLGDIRTMQDYYNIKINLPIIIKHFDEKGDPRFITAKSALDSQLVTFQNIYGYHNVMLVDNFGKIVYVTDSQESYRLGQSLQDLDSMAFEEGKSRIFVSKIFKISQNMNSYVLVTAPAKDSDGNHIGIIVLVVDMEPMLQTIYDTSSLGKTGETILVRDEGDHVLFLSSLRYDSDAAFNKKIYYGDDVAMPAQDAARGKSGSGQVIDYNGESVFAVWKYVPTLNVGLVTKITQKEINGQLDYVINYSITLAAIILGATMLIAIFLSFRLARPLNKLSALTSQISKGNYNVNLKSIGSDEVKSLIHSFNNLKSSFVSANKFSSDMKNALDKSAIVAITDKEGTITYVNEKFCKISQYSKEELIGQNHRMLKSGFHPQEFYQNMWNTITKGNVWHGDIKNRAKDGSFYWVSTTITPILDENKTPEQYIVIRIDVTETYRTREIIEGWEKILRKQYTELQQLDHQKDEFIAMVSHELKTPLSPISGYVEMLKEPNLLGTLNPSQFEAVDEIHKSTKRLEKLIGDILDISRIEIGQLKLKKEKFNVSELVKNTISALNPLIIPKNIRLSSDIKTEQTIFSDHDKLMEVLTNLVQNSIDFVENNGNIVISVDDVGGKIRFTVADDGIGIPEDKKDLIFKKFSQITTGLDRKHGGTGLGLAICKAIVESMGGSIWFESTKGDTKFFFEIPKDIVK